MNLIGLWILQIVVAYVIFGWVFNWRFETEDYIVLVILAIPIIGALFTLPLIMIKISDIINKKDNDRIS